MKTMAVNIIKQALLDKIREAVRPEKFRNLKVEELKGGDGGSILLTVKISEQSPNRYFTIKVIENQ